MGLPDSNNTSTLLKNLSKDLERMRVLIIDRHSSARHSLRVILSTLDISAIHNAGTTAEVMRQVKAYDFDIIFADYMLDDGRDGQQLLEELRQKHLISLSTVYMVITAERAYQNVVSVAELAPDLPAVWGDASQLRQIIHNLLRNAEDAQEGLPQARIEIKTRELDDMAELIVVDHGPGFPPEIIARVFEPYVTTKARGTGLGLAIVKKIVDEHQGRIRINNLQPTGAEVSIRLRLASEYE